MATYYDKRAATAELGQALARKGWKLLGWSADQSDSMTDYYCPKSWDGIATKDGMVLVADGCAWDVKSRSGYKQVRRERVPGERCERCEGSEIDPSGWTLYAAQDNPRQYNREASEYASRKGGRVRNLMGSVVSPIVFDKAGDSLRCWECNGRGTVSDTMQDIPVCTWPTFQANPGRSKWHIEKDGEIIVKGGGYFAAVNRNGYHERQANADTVAEKIEAKLTKALKPKRASRKPRAVKAASVDPWSAWSARAAV